MDGIFGIYGLDDNELVSKAFLATGACQHRGKASTGLAIANRKGIYIYKGLGRIAEVIDHSIIRTFQDLEPVAAIGNIGYTKRKIAEKINSEPIEIHPALNSRLSLLWTDMLSRKMIYWPSLKQITVLRQAIRQKLLVLCCINIFNRKELRLKPAKN